MTTNIALQSFENWSLLPPELRCLVVDKMDDQTLVNFAITCKENCYKIAKKRLEELNKPIVDNCKIYEESPMAFFIFSKDPNVTYMFVNSKSGAFDNSSRDEKSLCFLLDKSRNAKENLQSRAYRNHNQDSYDQLDESVQKMFKKVVDSVSKKYVRTPYCNIQ